MSSPSCLKRTDTEPSDFPDLMEPVVKRSRTLCDSQPHEDGEEKEFDSFQPDTEPTTPDTPHENQSHLDELTDHLLQSECGEGKLYDRPVLLIVRDLLPNEQCVVLLLPANSVPVQQVRTLQWCCENMPLKNDDSDPGSADLQHVLDFILGNCGKLPKGCRHDLVRLLGASSNLIATYEDLNDDATVRELGGNFSTITVIDLVRRFTPI